MKSPPRMERGNIFVRTTMPAAGPLVEIGACSFSRFRERKWSKIVPSLYFHFSRTFLHTLKCREGTTWKYANPFKELHLSHLEFRPQNCPIKAITPTTLSSIFRRENGKHLSRLHYFYFRPTAQIFKATGLVIVKQGLVLISWVSGKDAPCISR